MPHDSEVEIVQRAVGDRFRLEPIPHGFPSAREPWRLFPAIELSSGRKVAVKAIPVEDGDPVLGLRFEREVGSVESAPGWMGQPHLAHPRILPVLARSGRGVIYYVTPWLSEGTLRARLLGEPRIPMSDAVSILDDTAAALASLHARGFVHGRVKPENILFESGRAVLADGFSRVMGLVFGLPFEWKTNLDYEAPEVSRGERAGSARADVYSLAVVGFEMLAGRRPFLGDAMQATFAKLSGDAPALTSVVPEASPALSAVLQGALSRDPGARFVDAKELRRALSAAVR